MTYKQELYFIFRYFPKKSSAVVSVSNGRILSDGEQNYILEVLNQKKQCSKLA